jgi:hypothetical protein
MRAPGFGFRKVVSFQREGCESEKNTERVCPSENAYTNAEVQDKSAEGGDSRLVGDGVVGSSQ